MHSTDIPVRTTPFPNILIDVFMPRLTDTEFRVLTVVVRATLGWRDGSNTKRKRCDWLSHSQLKLRTGRESAAISAAIDGLSQRKLVEVRSEQGLLLSSSAETRRYRGKTYYCIPRAVLAIGRGN